MQRYFGIIVVGTSHGSNLFAHLVVVVGQRVDFAGIGVRQFCAEVGIAGKQVGKSVPTVVAREQDVYHGLAKWFDVGHETWAAFVEHEHDRFASGSQSLYEVALVL